MDTLEIPIFKSTYDLYRDFYDRLKRFPKSDRHAVGARCEESLNEILATLFRAGSVGRAEKAGHLDRASIQLNMLRIHLRLAKDVRALDLKSYVALQAKVDEIGRMLGGWRRSAAP